MARLIALELNMYIKTHSQMFSKKGLLEGRGEEYKVEMEMEMEMEAPKENFLLLPLQIIYI